MKKIMILFGLLVSFTLCSYSQIIDNLDYVSSLNEGLIAINKDNQWAFINSDGELIVDFRKDLIVTISEDGSYPIFKNGRCLITEQTNGITYFGYIDKMGNKVIKPEFLNATNFDNNIATALKIVKEEIGRNDALGKNIVYYRYYEVSIDTEGVVTNYLDTTGVNVVLDKEFLRKPPKIMTKRISDVLVAVKDAHGKWQIQKIN